MFGDIAQLGERMLHTHEVTGSSPVVSTITRAYELVFYGNVFALILKMPER